MFQQILLLVIACWIVVTAPEYMALGMQIAAVFCAMLVLISAAIALLSVIPVLVPGTRGNVVQGAAFSIWFVPACLLVATSLPIASALAMLIASLATHHLLSSTIRRSSARVTNTHRSVIRSLLLAVALQVSLLILLMGYGSYGVLLACCSTALWTIAAVSCGDHVPGKHQINWSNALACFLLAVLLLNLFPTFGTGLGMLDPHPPVATANAMPLETGAKAAVKDNKKGIPAIKLLPNGEPPRRLNFIKPTSRSRLYRGQPLVFPFTGEYHLYRFSSSLSKLNIPTIKGTPLDGVYSTLDGGTMVTEAFQVLYPPLDFADCAAIVVNVVSKEKDLIAVDMDLSQPGATRSLGQELLLGVGNSLAQKIEFKVPPSARSFVAQGIRISFHLGVTHPDQSKLIEVKSFELIPLN